MGIPLTTSGDRQFVIFPEPWVFSYHLVRKSPHQTFLVIPEEARLAVPAPPVNTLLHPPCPPHQLIKALFEDDPLGFLGRQQVPTHQCILLNSIVPNLAPPPKVICRSTFRHEGTQWAVMETSPQADCRVYVKEGKVKSLPLQVNGWIFYICMYNCHSLGT